MVEFHPGINCKGIKLSEENQTQNISVFMILFLWNSHCDNIMVMKTRFMVAKC